MKETCATVGRIWRRARRAILVLISIAGVSLAALPSAHAANGTWITDASSTWGTAANWLGGIIADGVDAIADFSTINITAARTVTLNTSRTIGTLIFGDTTPSHDWTLAASGGSILTLGVTSGTPTVQVNNRMVTVSLVLAGTQGLNKTGTGTLLLSGANTYSGDTTISAGVLRLGATGGIPSGAGKGNVFVDASGTLDLGTTGGSINGLSGTGTIDKSQTGSATLTIGNNDATSTFSGVIKNTAGTVNIAKVGAGTLTLNGTAGNTFTGTTTVNGGVLVLSKTTGNAVGGALTIGAGTVILTGSNQIADGGAVTINNAAGLLDLNGNSDTVGNTSVTGGSITTGGGTLTIGTLAMTGGSISTGTGALVLGGAVTGNASASSATISGNLNLGGAARTFAIADGTATHDMSISANISNGGITKIGLGALLLSGNNSFAGGLTVNSGKVILGSDTAAGTGTLTLAASITLEGSGGTRTITNNLTINGNVTFGGTDLVFSHSFNPGAART